MIRGIKKIVGVGINDADYNIRWFDEYGRRKMCPYYSVWYNMMNRCYSKSRTKTSYWYKGCSVCDEWIYFMNFRSWMIEQDWKGKHLDKDILKPLNKVYSYENCIFVKPELNTFFSDHKKIRGDLPLGVCYHKGGNKYLAQSSGKYLGLYNCPEEAHEVYRQYKHKLACKHADEQTDPRVAYALRQWYKPNGWYLIKEGENK